MDYKIIYLAGSLRGNWFQVKFNIRRARRYAKILWENGFIVYSPHLNSGWFNKKQYDEFVMNGNIEIMERVADIMFVMPKWERSVGTKREIYFMLKNSKGIYFNINTLLNDKKTNNIGKWTNDLEDLYKKVANIM